VNITKEALRGYILEEILAYLIKNTGYNLLVDQSQDSEELRNRRHGLVVKGRGAEHQADVLGQLRWIPAFTFPIRLFVEAKFRKSKTGIEPVRNAVGIVEDINQNYTRLEKSNILMKRYNYNYALFSTSGFSKSAVAMAMAHKISLIDLNTPDFQPLLSEIDNTAQSIIELFQWNQEIAVGKDYTYYNYNGNLPRNSFVSMLRKYIRLSLGTWPEGLLEWNINENIRYTVEDMFPQVIRNVLYDMFSTVRAFGELFIGMASGPFLIVLKADNPENFLSYVKDNPCHKVSIRWNKRDNNGLVWYIRPINYAKEPYKLSFALPEILGKWIFDNKESKERALDVKRKVFSSITIYRSSSEKDEIIRLEYSPSDIKADMQ